MKSTAWSVLLMMSFLEEKTCLFAQTELLATCFTLMVCCMFWALELAVPVTTPSSELVTSLLTKLSRFLRLAIWLLVLCAASMILPKA